MCESRNNKVACSIQWLQKYLQEVNGILDLHEEMHNIQQILFNLWKSESLSKNKTFAQTYKLLTRVISQSWLNYSFNELFLTFFSVSSSGKFRWITDVTSRDIPEFSSKQNHPDL